MLQHGMMVNEAYHKLLKKSPEYIQHIDEELLIEILSLQYDPILMRHYHLYHDCGKPYCAIQDENGAIHYTEHELISAQIVSAESL